MTNFIEKTIKFNELGGNPTGYDAHMLAFYLGMIMEESAEAFKAFNGGRDPTITALVNQLEAVGTGMKNGDYDHLSDGCDIIEVVDGAVDTAVVSLGTIMKTGFDPIAACDEVANSNLSKFVEDENGNLYALKNEQGKIMKGPKYFRPDLTKAIPVYSTGGDYHPSLH